MATCQNIIEGALRKIGVLAAGRSANQTDLDDVLEILKNSYRGLISSGAFGRMRDVTVFSGTYTAKPGDHVFVQTADSITLPLLVDISTVYEAFTDTASATSSTTQVSPPDGAVVRVTDVNTNNTIDWLYDGQTKNWGMLYEINLLDTAPLSFRDAEGLKSWLATQIADEYGAEVPPLTLRQARAFLWNLAAKYNSRRPDMPGEYF